MNKSLEVILTTIRLVCKLYLRVSCTKTIHGT
jgi:hypothetical protein